MAGQRRHDRAAPAGVEDGALRVAGPAELREAKVKELCPDCEIIYSNADQDAAKQQQQAEAALTKGAKVLVLDPVDAASAGAIVNRAKQAQMPVISYDRLITDADIDYYISFDNEQVGKLQGESLVKKLKPTTAPRAASS